MFTALILNDNFLGCPNQDCKEIRKGDNREILLQAHFGLPYEQEDNWGSGDHSIEENEK
jgi:hypothetical protein